MVWTYYNICHAAISYIYGSNQKSCQAITTSILSTTKLTLQGKPNKTINFKADNLDTDVTNF